MSDDAAQNSIEIFTTADNQTEIQVLVGDETVWLSQKQMADLFDKNRVTITEHIKNVFSEGELVEDSVCRDFRHTAQDGKNYQIKQYNLDVIISVGYRVKSQRGTQFRQWATQRLNEYLLKGVAIKCIAIGQSICNQPQQVNSVIAGLTRNLLSRLRVKPAVTINLIKES